MEWLFGVKITTNYEGNQVIRFPRIGSFVTINRDGSYTFVDTKPEFKQSTFLACNLARSKVFELISLDFEIERATRHCHLLDQEFVTGEVERITNDILRKKRQEKLEDKMVLSNKVLGSIKWDDDEKKL